jgi:tRNA A-37 threonylcarbamoyl transferase component Bud32
MKKSHDPNCPRCGLPVSTDAPDGLCPKCVMEGAETDLASPQAQKHRSPPPTLDDLSAAFPDLEILEIIGVGGMGAVYKARQSKLNRLVALKVLSDDLTSDSAFSERFNREARVLALLNHPNIVSVFDFGKQGRFLFLLMEYVDGVNMRQAMQAGRFSPDEALKIIPEICKALQFAHDKGILHRDIKPENILIDTKGHLKIADFGIAKFTGKQHENLTLTSEGAVLGSPLYMAPEQYKKPKDVDHRADIYSLGVVFYEMLTGELPVGRFAPPSEQSDVDARVDDVVMRTLEKERNRRYQSADALKTSVEAITPVPGQTVAHREASAAHTDPHKSEPSIRSLGSTRWATMAAVLTGIGLPLSFVVCRGSVCYSGYMEPIHRFGNFLLMVDTDSCDACLQRAGFCFGMPGFARHSKIRRSSGRLGTIDVRLFGVASFDSCRDMCYEFDDRFHGDIGPWSLVVRFIDPDDCGCRRICHPRRLAMGEMPPLGTSIDCIHSRSK